MSREEQSARIERPSTDVALDAQQPHAERPPTFLIAAACASALRSSRPFAIARAGCDR